MSDTIRSRPVTAEYEQGFTRSFGERVQRPGRTRYVQDPKTGELYAVSEDWAPSQRKVPVVGDAHYDGMRSPVDGADISSRTKHREYMREHGLTTADDYTDTWKRAADERAKPYVTDRTRRDDIGRAIYQLEQRRNAKH